MEGLDLGVSNLREDPTPVETEKSLILGPHLLLFSQVDEGLLVINLIF